jgi:hypothetical protein
LEEVWTHFGLVTNRCENRHDVVPMPVSMFGGCCEQKFDDLLNEEWLHLVEMPVRGLERSEREEPMLGRSLDSLWVGHKQV